MAETVALIVGVAEYSDPELRLSSPVHSAHALSAWLKAQLHNPAAPLGSLELLLSPTYAALEAAIGAWFTRAHADPNNVALFYFCGHGLMRTGALLLAADFDRNALNPYARALDFEKLVLGMGRCQASVQCFFVDACRRSNLQLRDEADLTAGVPIAPRLRDPPRSDSLVLYSSAPLEQASGAPNGPSRFTEALLDALGGLGSRKRAGRWEVSTSTLGDAVRRLLERRSAGAQKAIPHGSPQGAVLHVLADRPQVPLRIIITPATRSAALRLVRTGTDAVVAERPMRSGPWDIEVGAALYDLEARLIGKRVIRRDEIYVLPPEVDESLEVPT